MEGNGIQAKLKLLFAKLAEPNYVMDNYYVDGLINKLSNCSDPETSFLELPLLSDLIIEALNHTDKAHNTVKVFLIRALAIAAQREFHFAKIFAIQGDKIAAGFKEACAPNVNPSIKVSYMEVALAIVKHNSGIAWILETAIWTEILQLCKDRATVFIVRQTYKFMAEFLWTLNDLDDMANLRIVLDLILQPIIRIDFLNVQSMSSEEEQQMCQAIEPTIQILLSVVSKDNRIRNKTLLISMLLKEFKITQYLFLSCEWIRSETIMLVVKLLFWLCLCKVFLTKPWLPGTLYTCDDFLEASAVNFNVIQSFIQRRSVTLVLEYCSAIIIIWKTVSSGEEPEMWEQEDRQKLKMKNQMLFLCFVPILVFVTCKKKQSDLSDISDYISKLLVSSCEHTTKVAYSIRALTQELDTLSIILHSVKTLIYLKDYIDHEQGNLIFQALFYVLQDYDPVDVYGDVKLEENYEDCDEKVLVMTYVMDAVLSLITECDVSWHKSLEVICLYNIVSNILRRPNLTCKFIVKALNVITVTVKKFLQPNLSLLMDSQPGTPIHELGKLIYTKIHDRNWEVRDTALELLHVVTEISYIKFPPFQKQILENNLINVAATIAFNDYEAYVRVSALKCLAAASRVGVLWEKLEGEFPDLQVRLLTILRHNDEGIVRKEACNVLCDMYQNIKLTPAFKQTLYEHMVSSALGDFHWEVQISALKFWKIVYQSFLTNQGMLDGEFPPVTFSKESRKIVKLNEAEIQKRLLKILDELAVVGCLTVFVKLLHDETEVGILDASLSTAQELFDILNKYKLQECLTPKEGEITTVEELLCHIKEDKEDADSNVDMLDVLNPENVIEEILNADDINLLSSIYERHMTLQANRPEVPLKPKIKLLKFASPYLFVNHVKEKDFKVITDEKRKWNDGIRSISSLLDDMLGIYEVHNEEVNSLDCY